MKITLLRSLLVFGAFLCFGFMQAQEVTGTVSDANGPLPGASVVVKGTTTGTQTDFDGNYTIEADGNATLVFSYVGFKTTEVAVSNQSSVNVTLAEDAEALEEVVVVGYGSQAKKEITSAVVQLDQEEFNKGVVNSPAQLLQGKVAGLTVANRGGDPNSNGTIRLRGISTIGGSTEPLVVIDGVIGASLDNVDPSDIENINVLKDGSAAAIYGSRGSSGVILVTTKRGKGDSTSFDVSSQLSVSSVANTVDVMSADEFRAAGGVDLGSSNNWMDLVTINGTSKVNNFAVSGASDNINYRVSTNFRNTQGILRNSGFNQFNTRVNISTKLFDDRLDVNFNSSYTNRDSEFGFNEALRYAVLYNPTAPVLGVDSPFAFNPNQFGGYFEALGLFDSFNPVSIVNQNQNYGKRNEFLGGVNLKFRVLDNLFLNANYAKQLRTNNNRQYYPTTSHFRGGASSTIKGQGTLYNDRDDSELFETYATFSPQLNDKLYAVFTGGYSFQEQQFQKNGITLLDFPDASQNWLDNYTQSGAFSATNRLSGDVYTTPKNRTIAFFGRGNFTYDNAIFVNASVRREGSTRFGVDSKWGTFTAAGLGVDLNRYLELPNVNQLKLRLGYGETGSQPGGNYAQDRYNITTGNSAIGWNTSATPDILGNEELEWEKKKELNFGVEFATDRLTATLDLYNRNVSDFIIPIQDAESVNGAQKYENAGVLKVNGFEATINYDIVKNDKVTYNSGLIFATSKSVLDEYVNENATLRGNLGAPGQNDTEVILVKTGEQIGNIVGPRWDGTVDADGSQQFVDIDGDGTLETEQTAQNYEEGDLEVLGNGIPDFTLGWTNQVTFGKWSVNAFFRGAFGHSLVNNYRVFFEPRVGSQAGYNFVNTELADPSIKTAKFSSLYVEKADFFRLDNLSVNYTFDLGENIKKYVKSMSMNVAGQNLFTITGYTGNDPEPSLQDVGASDNGGVPDNIDSPDALTPGIDRRSNYFTSRTFSLGLTMKF